MCASPRLLIVEDQAVVAQSLMTSLRIEGFEVVEAVEGDSFDEASVLEAVERVRPDIVLLDLFLGERRLGLSLIPPLVERGLMVLMLTASKDSALLAQCIEAGASGLFNKALPFDQLVRLLRDAALGYTVLQPAARAELLAALRDQRRDERDRFAPFERLTPKESAVLAAIVDGYATEEIADDLDVSINTVRTHIQSVLRKLGVNSQLAAAALARRSGWTG